MNRRTGMAALALSLGLLLGASGARAGDLEDLKAAFDQSLKAWIARDAAGLAEGYHEQVVVFPAGSPFAADGKAAARDGLARALASLERVELGVIAPQFRVVGDTGLAWGHYAFTAKPKDGPLATSFGRYLASYVKTEGRWLLLSSHVSSLPSEN